jgi:2-iminobutanoate/2-iminopropanoate deaminase
MKSLFLPFTLLSFALAAPLAAQSDKQFITAPGRPAMVSPTNPSGTPPFSTAVLVGDTLYISGATDTDPATGKPPTDPKVGAKLLMDGLKRTLERAGMTMDDLVWVQIFATDLNTYAAFNDVYRTYFKGSLPARAFIGAGSLLNGSNYEIMGTAVKSKPK